VSSLVAILEQKEPGLEIPVNTELIMRESTARARAARHETAAR
jgi:hypothetical protein